MFQRFNILYNEAGDGGGGGSAGGNSDAGQANGGQGGAVGSGGSSTLFGGAAGGSTGGAAAGAGSGAGTETKGAAQGAWEGRIQADGTFADAWWEKDPELKEHSAHLSKYKTVGDAVKHTISLQQLLGKKSDAVIIPGPDSPPDVVDAFRKKIGVPDKPEGYGLKKPDNLPAGIEWDQARVDGFAKLAHDLSLMPQQVAKLQEWDMAEATGSATKTAEKIASIEKAELATQTAALTKEWGNGVEFKKNMDLATRAALTAGFTAEQLGLVENVDGDPIFRNAAVVKAFAKMGSLMSEDSLVKGAENSGFNDGYSKAMDIINNTANPLHKRYWDGDETVRAMVQEGIKRKK